MHPKFFNMRLSLCKSCMYFQCAEKHRDIVIKCHCMHPSLKSVFGPDRGFPIRIDMCHCDFHTQFPPTFGDVCFVDQSTGLSVSYFINVDRSGHRFPLDNVQSIKTIKL